MISPRLIVGGVVVLAVVGAIGTLWVQKSGLQRELAAERQGRAEAVAQAASAAAGELTRQLEEQRRRDDATRKALDDERLKNAALAADAASAADAVGRLRNAAARAAARSCPAAAHSPDASGSTPAADAGVVLADVLGRLAARGAELADLAGRRGLAGETCERERDALTTPPAGLRLPNVQSIPSAEP